MSGFEWSIVKVHVTIGEFRNNQKNGPADVSIRIGTKSPNKRIRTLTASPPAGKETRQTKVRKKSRHMHWNAGQSYALVREGIPLTEAQIDEFANNNKLTEDMFFIFKHRDQYQNRNEDIPLFEAVFLCAPPNSTDPMESWKRYKQQLWKECDISKITLPAGYCYVRTQKRHLSLAYNNSKRTDRERIWDVLHDGSPYWVDRHAYVVENEREVKKRHQAKKRRERQNVPSLK